MWWRSLAFTLNLSGLICWVDAEYAAAQPAASAGAESVDPGPPATQMDEVAQRHFQDAIRFYGTGNLEAARVEFEAAYSLSKLPDLLHNLSMVAEKQGQLREALRFEERCLAESPRSESSQQTRARIVRLRQLLGDSPPPGSSDVEVRSANATQRDGAVDRPVTGAKKPAVGIALIAGGAALIVAGAGCGGAALATSKQISGADRLLFEEYERLDQKGRALNSAAIGLGISGGVILAAGVGYVIYQRQRGR